MGVHQSQQSAKPGEKDGDYLRRKSKSGVLGRGELYLTKEEEDKAPFHQPHHSRGGLRKNNIEKPLLKLTE